MELRPVQDMVHQVTFSCKQKNFYFKVTKLNSHSELTKLNQDLGLELKNY